MIVGAALLGILVAALLTLARLFGGPTLYDRVLALNSFGTKTVLFLALFAAASGAPYAIDIALLYALINFVATIAILKFFRYRSLELALAAAPHNSDGDGHGHDGPPAPPRPEGVE